MGRKSLSDSIVVGASDSRLLQPRALERVLGGRFANLALNAGRAYEQYRLATLFIEEVADRRTLLVGLDRVWCADEADETRTTFRGFPEWMYDTDWRNDLRYMLNSKTVEISGRPARASPSMSGPRWSPWAYAALWHGAGWTFVLWGLGHGLGLLVCRFWQVYGRPLPSFAAWAITIGFVVLLFVLFRSPDLLTASNMFAGLAGQTWLGPMWPASTLVPIAIAGAIALFKVPTYELAMRLRPSWPVALGVALLGVICVLQVGEGAPLSFIYFQF